MKIKRLILGFAAVATAAIAAMASPAFIQHRQDAFKAVPTSKGQIIFLGNSITNFHCWADAFVHPQDAPLDESLVSNRGISDERAYHWKHNVQMMLDGEEKPAKVFIGIGTNDLNVGLPPEVVVNDIRAIIRQIQVSSPQTEINLQSILPRSSDINVAVTRTIPMLEEMAGEMGVNFINLTETMNSLGTPAQWAYDGLHPSGNAYRAWCQFIAPNVGLECAYHPTAVHNTGGFGAVQGIRAGQYGLMPVNEEDILILGDGWVDAVQWHELLGNANVRNRSICNGTLNMANLKTLVDRTLKGNDRQKTPRAIVVCWGAVRTGNNLNAATLKANYEELINYVKAAAPGATVIACQTPPTSADGHSANLEINKITSVPVVDLEAKGMTVGTTSEWNMAGGIGARGVIYAARAVAEALNDALGAGTVKVPSTAEFETRYANRNRRIEVAKCFNALYQHRLATDVNISADIADIEEILKNNTITDAQVTRAREIRDAALARLVFHPDPDKWYLISSPRNYEGSNASVRTLTHTGSNAFFFDNKLTEEVSDGSNLWSFRQRPDGTYDILSYDGYYIENNSSITLSKVFPTEGWTISAGSAETGTYIISCGDLHLHRDSQDNLINYWMKGDTGCDFYLTEYPGELPELDKMLADGWVTISVKSGFNVSNLGLAGSPVVNHPDGVNRSNGVYDLLCDQVDPARPATQFFHLTGNDNKTWTINGLSGHCYNESAVAKRNSDAVGIELIRQDETTYNIAYWTPFQQGTTKLVGRSSTNRAVYEVLPVSVEDYDIWKVDIVAVEKTYSNQDPKFGDKDIYQDTHITLDIPGNKGLKTVYNGGYYFLEPGTEFSADDITVECPNLAAQEQDYADVTIDLPSKTIFVDFSAGLPTGWYTLDLHSYTGSNNTIKNWFNAAVNAGKVCMTNTEDLHLQPASNYYGLAFETEQGDAPARHFVHLTSTGNNICAYRTLHGYYLAANSVCTRDAVDIATLPHPTADDVYRSTICIWGHNLGSSVPHDYLVGKFGSETMYCTIQPADLEPYDAYNVQMIEHFLGPTLPGDASLTLNDDSNRGIKTVRNNGTFFVTKGTDLRPEMFTASTLEGQPKPTISVEPGLITVDYTPVAVESIELDKTDLVLNVGDTAQLLADVLPENAHNKQVFWSSSDEEVATVNDEGLVTAIASGDAVITAFQGEISAECQVMVIKDNVAISEVNAPANPKALYDLQGRKVTAAPRRGIYIKADKSKIIIK